MARAKLTAFDQHEALDRAYELVPSLARATQKQRKNCEVGGMGTGLHWPDIDEDLSVEGLVLGRRVIDWQKNMD